jgi:hypothetical protein
LKPETIESALYSTQSADQELAIDHILNIDNRSFHSSDIVLSKNTDLIKIKVEEGYTNEITD